MIEAIGLDKGDDMSTPEKIARELNETMAISAEQMPIHDVDPHASTTIDIEDYHRDRTYLSKSQLVDLAECPAYFRWRHIEGNVPEQTDALRMGGALHCLALEPEAFDDRYYVITAGVRRDERTKPYQAEIEAAAGRVMLTAKQHAEVIAWANAITADPMAQKLFAGDGKIEQTIRWTDPDTGIALQCRPDFRRDDGMMVDIKTAANSEPRAFFGAIWDHGYDISAALTAWGYRALTGEMPDNYVFVVVDKRWPNVECFDAFRAPPGDLGGLSLYEIGEYRLRNLLRTYAECAEAGTWPGYNGGKIRPADIPEWAKRKLEDDTV